MPPTAGARRSAPIKPGQELHWRYSVKFLTAAQSRPLIQAAHRVPVTLPRLEVPREDVDYRVCVDVILDGQGVGWLTDVDVELVRLRAGVAAGV